MSRYEEQSGDAEQEDEDGEDLSIIEQFYQGRPEYLHRDPEVLESYVDDGYTVPEIAERLYVSEATIRNWLDQHEIPIPKRVKYPELRDEEWLRQKHIDEGLTYIEIADELGCHKATVGKWIRERHEIQKDGSGGA